MSDKFNPVDKIEQAIDWLKSKKFWGALVAVVVGLGAFFGYDITEFVNEFVGDFIGTVDTVWTYLIIVISTVIAFVEDVKAAIKKFLGKE